jgi:hypothetical protein
MHFRAQGNLYSPCTALPWTRRRSACPRGGGWRRPAARGSAAPSAASPRVEPAAAHARVGLVFVKRKVSIFFKVVLLCAFVMWMWVPCVGREETPRPPPPSSTGRRGIVASPVVVNETLKGAGQTPPDRENWRAVLGTAPPPKKTKNQKGSEMEECVRGAGEHATHQALIQRLALTAVHLVWTGASSVLASERNFGVWCGHTQRARRFISFSVVSKSLRFSPACPFPHSYYFFPSRRIAQLEAPART